MGDAARDDALRAALRDDFFPALLAGASDLPRRDGLRGLLRLVAEAQAAARGVALPEAALGGPDGLPRAAREAARARLAGLDVGAAGVHLPGLLYADLVTDRRGRGSYYTPPGLAGLVAGWTLEPLLPSPPGPLSQWERGSPGEARAGVEVLDPAMGSGHFLIAAGEVLAGARRGGSRQEVTGRLYGIDRDPLAVELARLALWLWACEPDGGRDAGALWAELARRLVCADALLDDPFPDGFDAVVGNPPFASVFTRARGGDDGQREALQARYVTASGSFDLAVPFVERAVRYCRVGGRIGLVLPNKLLAADYARDLRGWLAARVTVEAVVDYSQAPPFEASVYPVAVVMRRERSQPDAPLAVYRGGEQAGGPSIVRRGRQADLHGTPGAVWSAALDPAWGALRACFDGAVRLADVAELSGGLTVGEAYDLRPRVVDAPLGVLPPDAVRLITSGLVRRYGTRWGQTPARYLNRRYQRPVVMVGVLPARRQAQARSDKIIVAGLGLRPRACVDRGLAQASVATTAITGSTWPLGALCAVLNSALVARLYRALYGGLALSGGYLRFGKRELGALPLPDLPGGDPRLARLDALAADLTVYTARGDMLACTDLDAQIDALAFALYGIDPAQVAGGV